MEECSKPKVSIVVPTYNEAPVIKRFLDSVRNSLDDKIGCYEVIVVDDDSPDGTWRIVQEESARDDRIRLIRRIGERGLATAVLRGIKEARSDLVVVMDADLQHPPEILPSMIEKAEEGYDIVVASRYTRGGGVAGWSKTRLAMSRVAIMLAKVLVKEARRTSDPMSGFFLVRRSIVNPEELAPRGYKILLEILAKAPEARVADIPYIFRSRAGGESKLGLNVIIDFIAHVINLSKIARFAMVGGIGAIINLTVMHLALGHVGVDLASILGIEAGILWNFMLHERWTFKSRFSRGVAGRLVGYHFSSLGGILTTYTVMRIIYTVLGVNPVLAQAVGIIAGFLLNYLLSSGVVWGGAASKAPQGASRSGSQV